MVTTVYFILLVWATVGGAVLAWHIDRNYEVPAPLWATRLLYGPVIWLILAIVGVNEVYEHLKDKRQRK